MSVSSSSWMIAAGSLGRSPPGELSATGTLYVASVASSWSTVATQTTTSASPPPIGESSSQRTVRITAPPPYQRWRGSHAASASSRVVRTASMSMVPFTRAAPRW